MSKPVHLYLDQSDGISSVKHQTGCCLKLEAILITLESREPWESDWPDSSPSSTQLTVAAKEEGSRTHVCPGAVYKCPDVSMSLEWKWRGSEGDGQGPPPSVSSLEGEQGYRYQITLLLGKGENCSPRGWREVCLFGFPTEAHHLCSVQPRPVTTSCHPGAPPADWAPQTP
ncbi:uncharacterized protein LOC144221185 [Crocuta crocuta]